MYAVFEDGSRQYRVEEGDVVKVDFRAAEVGATLKDLDVFPTPEEAPDLYVDFDETGPYVAEVGDSECAT